MGELAGDYYGVVGRGLLWGSWQGTTMGELAGNYYWGVGRGPLYGGVGRGLLYGGVGRGSHYGGVRRRQLWGSWKGTTMGDLDEDYHGGVVRELRRGSYARSCIQAICKGELVGNYFSAEIRGNWARSCVLVLLAAELPELEKDK